SRGMTLYAQAQKTSHEISLRRAAREKVMSERELATEHEMAAITKARIAKLSSSRSRDDSDDTEVASRRDPQKMSTADRTSGA
ncbi:hypothetical protein, partial [Frankia sp. EI5c]|uniref:hypothetical protein n=1 Tax=Frankia sp. EI5c TaxID=683316 RepID=UPI001A7E2110